MTKTLSDQLKEYIGLQIVAAREKHDPKISQEVLAEMAGTSRQNLGLIERGESWPSNDLAIALSAALGVPPAYFFPNFLLGEETDKGAELIDQISKDVIQMRPRELKVAALIIRTLLEKGEALDDQ